MGKKKKTGKEKKKAKKINWSFIFSLVAVIISGLSAYFTYESNQLYKRDIESKILEIDLKRTDLLLEMLSLLKKVHFRLIMENGEFSRGMYPVSFNYGYKRDRQISSEYLNSPVVFLQNDVDSILPLVLELAENPILPVEIKEKTSFMRFTGGRNNPIEIKENIHTIVELSHEPNKNFDDIILLFNNECTLGDYLKKYEDLFNEINIWIERTTKTEHKLNI